MAKVDRVHSSDTQVFVDTVRIPMINSLSFSSSKNIVDLPALGVSHVQDRILGRNQSTSIDLGAIICTGASGIDPLYKFQQRNFGFLNTGKYDFQIKDLAGVTTISTHTPAGALTISNQTEDEFGGVFAPNDIEITTTTNGSESVNSNSMTIQDFDISVSLTRNPVTRLGEREPEFRYPELPAQGNLSFSAVKNQVTGLNLSSLVCESGIIKIDLKDANGDSVMDFTTSGCCLESVDESTSLDDNNMVSFTYYFPILL